MPLFSQDQIDAARRREAARDASLRTTTAGELRDWLAGQDDVADACARPGSPATIAVRLAGGLLLDVTVSTDGCPDSPAASGALAHHALAERIRTWIAAESGIDQTWAIPGSTAVGVELVDGTDFTITVSSHTT